MSKRSPSELVLKLSVLDLNHIQVDKSQKPNISTTIVALRVCGVFSRLLEAS